MSRTLGLLDDEYFDWMYDLVCNDKYSKLSYRKLLTHLHKLEFTYIIPMDKNRAGDGTNLRYRFAYERYHNDIHKVMNYLDDGPCSVLEMLIALAIRCEEQIMDDPDIGDRTGQWFWNMLVNLGLGGMSDSKFNEQRTDEIVGKFLNREYEENGEGGLFTLKHCGYDLRTVEIWYQMLWYLDENY